MTKPVSPPRAEQTLSFMRRATPAEQQSGSMPIIYWSVEPSGTYSVDVQRGQEIAEEFVAFLMAHPTNGNVGLLGCILADMTRFARGHERGFMIGFGSVIGKFALIGGTIAGSDAIRRHEESRRKDLVGNLRDGGDNDLADAFETGRLR